MKPEIPLKGGNEYDCLTGWRKVLKLNQSKKRDAKKSYWKRVRRHIKETFSIPIMSQYGNTDPTLTRTKDDITNCDNKKDKI